MWAKMGLLQNDYIYMYVHVVSTYIFLIYVCIKISKAYISKKKKKKRMGLMWYGLQQSYYFQIGVHLSHKKQILQMLWNLEHKS